MVRTKLATSRQNLPDSSDEVLTRSKAMRPHRFYIFTTYLTLAAFAQGDPPGPQWWHDADPPVIAPGSATNNRGPANIGQAKHMAKSGLDALRSKLPDLANEIESELVGAGKPIPTWDAPQDLASRLGNYAPLQIGQLKAIAHPFYNGLNTIAPAWVLEQIQHVHGDAAIAGTHYWQVTGRPNYTENGYFPWNPETQAETNKSVATVGQLKAVFALDFATVPASPPTDSDGDGLDDAFELILGTSPNNPDTDFDGISDLVESQGATDPKVADTDQDGSKDGQEVDAGTDPVSPQSAPLRWVSTGKSGAGNATPPFIWVSWDSTKNQGGDFWKNSDLAAALSAIEFPTAVPNEPNAGFSCQVFGESIAGTSANYRVGGEGGGQMSQACFFLEVRPATQVEIRRVALKVTRTFENGVEQDPIIEKVEFTIPAGGTLSNRIDLLLVPTGSIDRAEQFLVPLDSAPEVLSVNSDFDEGRIDPATGYAIPDCDDIPGVDQESGSGNTQIALNATRAHLDGLFANDEKVTNDMHKGWFGVNPNRAYNEFWEGAKVTIRKIDKIDDQTGYKESGQVRFYAKWSNGYYGISPYDFQTLQPVNLVLSGVNKRPGEGVYGSTSTIPGGEFWMEGVRPGKITLEWRYQKGDIDIRHEETFIVATHQSKQEWIDQVYYQVKLQSTHWQSILSDPQYGLSYVHPLGAFPINLNQYDPSRGFFLPESRNYVYIQAIYYYYSQLFDQRPEKLYWAGMAKTAGAAVYAGMVDMNTWKISVFVNDAKVDEVLNDFMIQGNKDIFLDQSWAHHAYISSGIWALRYLMGQQVDDGTFDDQPFTDYSAWEEIDQGVEENETQMLHEGNKKLLRREQEVVMQPLYEVMKSVWLDPVGLEQFLATSFTEITYPPENGEGEINIDEMFTINGRNPVHLTGPKLRMVVPSGRLSNFDDRWAWIDNDQNGMVQIWLGTSSSIVGFTEANRRNLNSSVFKQHSALYSQLPTEDDFHLKQFPPGW